MKAYLIGLKGCICSIPYNLSTIVNQSYRGNLHIKMLTPATYYTQTLKINRFITMIQQQNITPTY